MMILSLKGKLGQLNQHGVTFVSPKVIAAVYQITRNLSVAEKARDDVYVVGYVLKNKLFKVAILECSVVL